MSPSRIASFRRLLADLRRTDQRGDALRRVRRRAVAEIRGSAPKPGAGTRGSAGAPPGTPARVVRPDAWYVGEWNRLARSVLGRDVAPGEPSLDPAVAPRAIAAARRLDGQAVLSRAIARGEPLEQAVCASVAALADAAEWHAAWSMAEGVSRLPGGATASALGHLVLLHRRRQFTRSWNVVRNLDDASLGTWAPIEAVDAALAAGTPDSRRRALAIGAPSEAMDAQTLVDLAGRFLAFGERDRAAGLMAELRRRPTLDLDERRRYARTLIEAWLVRRPVTVPAGAVPVAVIDYQSPDHVLTSGNLGDYIQTLAMLGNLVRLTGLTLSGDDGLGELATELQGRVPPRLRLPDITGSVHLVPVDREFSSAASVPPGTWMLAFGWHMHALFDLRHDFPYHPNIRPLFVSFHVNRLEMLTDEARDYLQRHGPIGCRDWNTVFLLLGAGIDAFFSGCLTTTVDGVFPPREAAYRGKGSVGVIDQPPTSAGSGARHVRVYSHQLDDYRYMSLVDGVRAASDALAGYQRDLERAVTSRLHAYLPLTSLGVPVEFKASLPGDVRFAGLTGLRPGDARLDQIRGGIRDLIATTFARIVAGAPEDEVYALWRDLTADRVAEARARFEAPVAARTTTIDIAGAVATAWAGSRRFGPHAGLDPSTITDVVLCFDQNLLLPAAVLLESMVANASGPLRLWVLGRGLPDSYAGWLGAAFPTVAMTFLPCDQVGYGARARPRRIPARITISTMDRLLLPRMLEDVDRVVYLDVDTLMLGDVCSLARTDLGGAPIAARDSNVSEASEWQRSGRALDEITATDLRRQMSLRHGFGHAALNAGVLVLDLDRMRRDDFTATYLGWVEELGLHDQDTMLAYAGPDRRVLEPAWNAMPVLEDVDDPRLIHWASFGKPWDHELTYGKELWRAHAARLHDRAGTPPAPDADSGHADEAAPGVAAAGAAASGGLAAHAGILRSPVQVGPQTAPLSADLEEVIERVRAENLSYLDATSLRTLAAAVADIEAGGIVGLIVEAGAARGGSAITMAAAKSAERRMKVYDVFGMIPPPAERDGEDVHRRYATIASGHSAGIGGETYYGYRDDLLAEVTDSFARHGHPIVDSNVELIQGLFDETIALDEPVALAHLDGDWYASTMTCLTRIAPLLSVGGRLVIDDYDTWSGCRAAVDEYFAGRPGFRFERRGRLHAVRV